MSKIRNLREVAGLSQQGLADKAGMSRSMVSAIECGEKTPSLRMIKRLALGLDISMRRILNAVNGSPV